MKRRGALETQPPAQRSQPDPGRIQEDQPSFTIAKQLGIRRNQLGSGDLQKNPRRHLHERLTRSRHTEAQNLQPLGAGERVHRTFTTVLLVILDHEEIDPRPRGIRRQLFFFARRGPCFFHLSSTSALRPSPR